MKDSNTIFAIDTQGNIHDLVYPRSDAFFESHWDLLPCDGREIPDNSIWKNLRLTLWLTLWADQDGKIRVPDLRNHDKVAISCTHEFKLYEGFTEKYEYCIYCDIKRLP